MQFFKSTFNVAIILKYVNPNLNRQQYAGFKINGCPGQVKRYVRQVDLETLAQLGTSFSDDYGNGGVSTRAVLV